MDFKQLTTELKDTPQRLLTFKKGQHYSFFVGKITFMPTTKEQFRRQISHIKNGGFDNLLMCGEWFPIEEFLNKNGFKGEYHLTKSKTMCRLENMNEYILALKKEIKTIAE